MNDPEPCFVCGTPIVDTGDAGWRHLASHTDRDGCGIAIPTHTLAAEPAELIDPPEIGGP